MTNIPKDLIQDHLDRAIEVVLEMKIEDEVVFELEIQKQFCSLMKITLIELGNDPTEVDDYLDGVEITVFDNQSVQN